MQQVSKRLESSSTLTTEKGRIYPKFISENVHRDNRSAIKKIKMKKREKVIFGLIRDEFASGVTTILNESPREVTGNKKESRRRKKESCFNTGRWHTEEHQRFIEALLKFGNDWKSVQRYVGSRSSTQARSHAQKFFVKIGKTQIENLQLDFENNSLKSLNIMANNLNNDQMARAIKSLNELAFDKKNSGRKNGKIVRAQENASLTNKLENKINLYQNDSEYDSPNDFNLFSQDDKLMHNYSTSVEISQNGYPMTKRKRIRTLKKKPGLLKKESQFLSTEPLRFLKDDPTTNTDAEELKNNRRSMRSSFNGIYQSNRKSSFDCMCPTFNFVNDNSIFLSNTYIRNHFKVEEKDFQVVFENSFKFANEKANEEHLIQDDEFSGILFVDENVSSNTNRRSSSSEIEPVININETNYDIISKFMD